MKEEPEKLETLLDFLTQSDKALIRRGVDALLLLAQQSPHLAARLEDLLAQTEREKRWPIAYLLGQLGQPSRLTLGVLLDTLGSEDPDVRWAVTLLLTRIAKSSYEVVERLLDLLRSGTSTQRRMAIYCVRDLDPNYPAILETFLKALHDTEPLIRVAAVSSLVKRPEAGREKLDSLISLLIHDPDSRVQCAAALALARLREPAGTIRTVLEDALRGGNLQLQKACRAALELLEKKEPVPPTR